MAALDPRYEPGAMPPDVPINSKGMPYSPDLDTMSPQEKANVAASMAAIKAKGGLGSSQGALATAQPSASAPAQPAATVQSEPTPPPKPAINPIPYAWFKENNPTIAGWIDKAAEITGASPQRLAVHKMLESGKGETSRRGADGEIGVMQILPSTWDKIDPKHDLDPSDGLQGMILAGTLIHKLDGPYGRDTPLSVARYNGSGPKAIAYARRGAFLDPIHDSAFHEDHGTSTPQGLVKAGAEGGPDAFMKYMVDTAPKNLGMTDKWRNAEALLVGAAIRKGDLAGAQAARDFVASMSHSGTNQYLMAAHQALTAGQGVTAAQLLAKAHAFFPDGTVGRFSSNGTQVHAERVDENNPSISYGASPITPDSVLALLNQTSDPQQYLKLVSEQQKAQANAFMSQAHGNYYAQLPQIKQNQMATQLMVGQGHDQARLDAANMHGQNALNIAQFNQGSANAREQSKQDNANYRAGLRGSGDNSTAIDKEASSVYDPALNPNDPTIGRKGEMYAALRNGGVKGPMAQQITNGLAAGSMRLGTDGSVVDGSGNRIAYLAPTIVQKFTSPVSAQPRQVPPPPQPMAGVPGSVAGGPARSASAPMMRPNPFAGAPQAQIPAQPMNALQYALPPSSEDDED